MLEIKPLRRRDLFKVELPGSKSYSQRALVIAALAKGESRLSNVLISEDTILLMKALSLLGARMTKEGDELIVHGTDGRIRNPAKKIFLGNNGTALRFLTSLVSLGEGSYILTGDPRLCERPVKPLIEALQKLGVTIGTEDGRGFPPLTIQAQGIEGGAATFHNISSSQYISSLLICAPYAKGDVEIVLSGRLVSQPYIEMTLEAMGCFGVQVTRKNLNHYLVRSGQHYKGRSYLIEGDASTASYFFLAAALCRSCIRVMNINPESLQGDIHLLEIMEKLGCHVGRGKDWIEVTGGPLTAGDFCVDMGDMPDMVPTLAVMSVFRAGKTQITNVAHLRIKESDRIKALVNEINRMGISAEEKPDGLVIWGGKPQGAEIETYNDHRIAMSFAIAGLCVPGVVITNEGCVKKSFPAFWEELDKLYAY